MTRAHRITSILAALLILTAPTAPTTQAQTPATTVKDSGENVVLQSNADGGLLVPGAFGTGTIPAEGAGTRMMWYPAKAAFRAGRVGIIEDGTQWDAGKVGFYSVAFGADTKASGIGAMAMGNNTIASANYATAMGERTTASGRRSTAMGRATTASGWNATAMGRATTAATDRSLSIGECNSANSSADKILFAVGNGSYDFRSSCSSRNDAFTVDTDGNATASAHKTFSDRRLKTAIEPLGSGILKKLTRLRPVRYVFKNQTTHPSGEQVGLVAQDVRKEFPSLVSKGSEGMLSLAYPKLTAVLLKGLQEQQAQIDSLKTRIRSLQTVKKRQARLARQVAALQQSRSGTLPAGWGASALLILLVGGGSFGAGLLWRRTAA